MPTQPRVTLIGRSHRVLAFLGIAGLMGTTMLTVVGVNTTARGGDIECGSLLSPMNKTDISEALSCSISLGPRRMVTLLLLLASIFVLTLFASSVLAPTPGRRAAPTRGSHVTVRIPQRKDAPQVQATIDDVVIAEMGWTEAESESWPNSVRTGSLSGPPWTRDDV
jgi:hypothetical protein